MSTDIICREYKVTKWSEALGNEICFDILYLVQHDEN